MIAYSRTSARRCHKRPCLSRTQQRTAATRDIAQDSGSAAYDESDATARQAGASSSDMGHTSAYVPMASVSRAVYTTLRHVNIRHLTQRPAAGPLGIVLIVASVLWLIRKAYKKFVLTMMRFARGCRNCRGYGIERCNMCEGQGTVRWDAKWCAMHSLYCTLLSIGDSVLDSVYLNLPDICKT